MGAQLIHRTLRLQKSNIFLVHLFAIVFTGFILSFQLAFSIIITADFRSNDSNQLWIRCIGIGWIIVFSGIALLNFGAFVRIFRFQRLHSTLMLDISKLLRNIQISAIFIALLAIGAIVCLGVMTLLPVRGYYNDPYCSLDVPSFALRFSKIFIMLGNVVAVWFVSNPVKQMRERAQRAKSCAASLSENRESSSSRSNLRNPPMCATTMYPPSVKTS
jgi:hypothetical protein